MKLEGRVALITGGGTGIGRTIAITFAREGADIALAGRRSKPLEEVTAEVRAHGRKAIAIPCDISSEEEVEAMVERIAEELGGVDVLINNASVVGQVAPVEQLDMQEWDKALAINLTGAVLCARAGIKHLKESAGGAIVNVSSNIGRRGFPNRAPYVCSKWAMQGLTQTLALELGQYNVRVNAICPGPILTDRLKSAMDKMARTRGISVEEVHREWVADSPLGRFATVQECADAALYFASDDSSGSTGQSLNVTAGALMS